MNGASGGIGQQHAQLADDGMNTHECAGATPVGCTRIPIIIGLGGTPRGSFNSDAPTDQSSSDAAASAEASADGAGESTLLQRLSNQLPAVPESLGNLAAAANSRLLPFTAVPGLLTGYAAELANTLDNLHLIEDLNASLTQLVARLYALGSISGDPPIAGTTSDEQATAAAAALLSGDAGGALEGVAATASEDACAALAHAGGCPAAAGAISSEQAACEAQRGTVTAPSSLHDAVDAAKRKSDAATSTATGGPGKQPQAGAGGAWTRPGVMMREKGYRAKHPVVIVPGFTASGLELWDGQVGMLGGLGQGWRLPPCPSDVWP